MYLTNELAKLSDEGIKVKFINSEGQTKWLSLTPAQVREVRALLARFDQEER